ncbi:putative tubulin-specific chaperone c [Paramicrosporidium saccamoebae]|uniref:Putative tubulin-specific chaperone c n=1 Tax=Paramicrosporidium saccamoebae TaxID=1246581 RepID=A0A2H9TFN6_9FUNG|nr:putative tubulin-specific chaperone c [Paramicrosporidium saccamoebae]
MGLAALSKSSNNLTITKRHDCSAWWVVRDCGPISHNIFILWGKCTAKALIANILMVNVLLANVSMVNVSMAHHQTPAIPQIPMEMDKVEPSAFNIALIWHMIDWGKDTVNGLCLIAIELEKSTDYGEADLIKVQKALSNGASFMSAYNARTLRDRLDKLRKKGVPLKADVLAHGCHVDRQRDGLEPIVLNCNDTLIDGPAVRLVDLSGAKVELDKVVDSVYLLNLSESKVKVGPCSGAAYCENVSCSELYIAAHQIRFFNCKNVQLHAFTATSIILEGCDKIEVVPIDDWYATMASDMVLAKLDGENRFQHIVDFTLL